jgi:hypothetical protein
MKHFRDPNGALQKERLSTGQRVLMYITLAMILAWIAYGVFG